MMTEDVAGSEQPEPVAPNIEELVPAVGMGAADPEEAGAVLAGLATQPELAAELSEYAAMQRALLYSSPPLAPPPALEARLRAALTVGAPATPELTPELAPVPVVKGWRCLVRDFFGSPLRLATGALIVVLLLANLFLLNQVGRLRMSQSDLRDEIARLNATQLALDDQLGLQAQAVAMLADATPQETVLASPDGATPSEASVLWNPEWRVGVLYAHEFPPLAQDMVYQLWLNQDGQRTSAGLFTVDDTGNGSLVFHLPVNLDELTSLGVTTEPAGGSPGPTSPAVVRLQL